MPTAEAVAVQGGGGAATSSAAAVAAAAAVASSLQKQNALENWAQIRSLMDNKQACLSYEYRVHV